MGSFKESSATYSLKEWRENIYDISYFILIKYKNIYPSDDVGVLEGRLPSS